ncbi:MAG: Permease of the drug/metabolite transporter superfamily [Labilithrix sp.]|nr:Permease of the drug/metabolite transporter superfamily [Labilithrix sp.]
MGPPQRSQAAHGTLLALASAVAFGVTTPLVQRLGRGAGSFATAALLYAGAAAVGLVTRSRGEAPLRRAHAPRLLAMGVLGAGLAPAALVWGLARASGASASLMLNLEAVFTIALARLFYGEHVGRRVALAALLLLGGGTLLVVTHGSSDARAGAVGLAAVAGAALGWALDNAIARPLAEVDPARVVAAKASVGASVAALVAAGLGEPWPPLASLLGLLSVGAVGYGASLRLYFMAQRVLGAGRTASVFAAAPFCGAVLAWILGEPAGPFAAVAAALMVGGIALHLTERHAHVHAHVPLEHEHAHRHDDGHHDHVHDPMPVGEHVHPHRHGRKVHAHEHVPDAHHVHAHEHGPGGHHHD